MTTFELNGNVDEIQEPVLLVNDKYALIISQEPEIQPNKKMRDEGADAEGAGHNIILRTRVYLPENPEFHGRQMNNIYLPVVKDGDDAKYNARGMTLKDAKLERIAEVVEGFGGSVDGDSVTISKYMMAVGTVIQKKNDTTSKMENELQVFGQSGKPAFEPYDGPRPDDYENLFK